MLSKLKDEILKQLELSLQDETLAHSPELAEAVRYSVFPPGKCIRPLIACALAEDLGGKGMELAPIAVALELIHVSTLIHDDLPEMDNDSTRRGRPSTHVKFGHATALLAGNYLAARAFAWVSSCEQSSIVDRLNFMKIFAFALTEVNLGQQLDVTPRSKKNLQTQIFKTGALFSAAFKIAATSASVSTEELEFAGLLGEYYGLLFQMVDDAFDGETSLEAELPRLADLSKYLIRSQELPNSILRDISDLFSEEITASKKKRFRNPIRDLSSLSMRLLVENLPMASFSDEATKIN